MTIYDSIERPVRSAESMIQLELAARMGPILKEAFPKSHIVTRGQVGETLAALAVRFVRDRAADAGFTTREGGEEAVAAILADLRGRKLLKWLFAETADADPHPIGYVDGPIDLATQMECVRTWVRLATTSSPDASPDATPA